MVQLEGFQNEDTPSAFLEPPGSARRGFLTHTVWDSRRGAQDCLTCTPILPLATEGQGVVHKDGSPVHRTDLFRYSVLCVSQTQHWANGPLFVILAPSALTLSYLRGVMVSCEKHQPYEEDFCLLPRYFRSVDVTCSGNKAGRQIHKSQGRYCWSQIPSPLYLRSPSESRRRTERESSAAPLPQPHPPRLPSQWPLPPARPLLWWGRARPSRSLPVAHARWGQAEEAGGANGRRAVPPLAPPRGSPPWCWRAWRASLRFSCPPTSSAYLCPRASAASSASQVSGGPAPFPPSSPRRGRCGGRCGGRGGAGGRPGWWLCSGAAEAERAAGGEWSEDVVLPLRGYRRKGARQGLGCAVR